MRSFNGATLKNNLNYTRKAVKRHAPNHQMNFHSDVFPRHKQTLARKTAQSTPISLHHPLEAIDNMCPIALRQRVAGVFGVSGAIVGMGPGRGEEN